MNNEEFADKFFKEARNNGYQITSHGNIKCTHDKNLSKDKLKNIHQLFGNKCKIATSQELSQVGIQSCCFAIFRQIAQLIYP